jgi:hypothetical protein
LLGPLLSTGSTSSSGSGGRADGVVRRKAVVGAGGGALDVPTSGAIADAQRGGSLLAAPVRAPMEQAFGADFAGVRVHADQQAGELCDHLRARAFTVGHHIFFRDGRPGDRLLAHELAHVAQSAGSAPAEIRRAYLDGTSNWKQESTLINPETHEPRRRSGGVERIDKAVKKVQDKYWKGVFPELEAEITRLQTAITRWGGEGAWRTARKRGPSVWALQNEANTLAGQLRGWQGVDYDAAIAEHKADRANVYVWLQQGARQNQNIRLRNSCQAVMADKVKLYVLTRTGDDVYRRKVLLHRQGKTPSAEDTCYFPNPDAGLGEVRGRHMNKNIYDKRDAIDYKNVHLAGSEVGWTQPGRYIAVTHAGLPNRETFHQLLTHEMQHMFDRHQDTRVRRGPDRDFWAALREYKTEYRAYSYQGGDDQIDRATHDVQHPTDRGGRIFRTDRQQVIWDKILATYPRIKAQAWRSDFKRLAAQYRDPDTEGYNKLNSWRIDVLYDALDEVPKKTTAADNAKVVAVLDAARNLDVHDARYIMGDGEAIKLQDKIDHHLAGDAFRAFTEILRAKL